MNPINRGPIQFSPAPKPGDEIKDILKNRGTEQSGPVIPIKKEDLNKAEGQPTEPPRASFASREEDLKRIAGKS